MNNNLFISNRFGSTIFNNNQVMKKLSRTIFNVYLLYIVLHFYNSYKQSSKIFFGYLPFSSKTDLTITVNIWSFRILPKDKSSSDSNFIFMKSLSSSLASPPLIVLINQIFNFIAKFCVLCQYFFVFMYKTQN